MQVRITLLVIYMLVYLDDGLTSGGILLPADVSPVDTKIKAKNTTMMSIF